VSEGVRCGVRELAGDGVNRVRLLALVPGGDLCQSAGLAQQVGQDTKDRDIGCCVAQAVQSLALATARRTGEGHRQILA
jgi:hypothetical protein